MEINLATRLLLNRPFRWLLWTIVMILNFIAYYQDPIRMSQTDCVFGVPCKWTAFIAGIATFGMDCLTFVGLWLTIPFTNKLPSFWYLPFILVGFALITQITIDAKTYSDDGSFNPPPRKLWPKRNRIILYSIILFINVLIFLQFYVASGIKDYSKTTLLDVVFLQRFGGISGNQISFIISWSAVLGIFIACFTLYLIYTYYPCIYNQPKSWNF